MKKISFENNFSTSSWVTNSDRHFPFGLLGIPFKDDKLSVFDISLSISHNRLGEIVKYRMKIFTKPGLRLSQQKSGKNKVFSFLSELGQAQES